MKGIEATEVVSKPYLVYVMGEIGVGKSTLLRLWDAHQRWLRDECSLEHTLVTTYIEELPPNWAEFIEKKNNDEKHPAIADGQEWFGGAKRNRIMIASGLEDLEGRTLKKDPRSPGFYSIDRALEEDLLLAEDVKHQFPNGRYERYLMQMGVYNKECPPPDLVLRVTLSSAKASYELAQNVRKKGENLPEWRYHKNFYDYAKRIDPLIEKWGVPVINVQIDAGHLDFHTTEGQVHCLTELYEGLHNHKDTCGVSFWKPNGVYVPNHNLIELED